MRVELLNPTPVHGEPCKANPALTVRDLATSLGKSERAIRQLIADSGIKPAARYGRAFAYWRSDVAVAERDTRKRRLMPLAGRWRSRPAYLEPDG